MTEAVIALHGAIALAVLLYALLAGLWGIAEYLRFRGAIPVASAPGESTRTRALSPTYAGILALAAGLTAVQAIAGLYALFAGRMPPDPLHIVYGTLSALLLPMVYISQSKSRRIALWMGIACLVIAAAATRAYLTGGR